MGLPRVTQLIREVENWWGGANMIDDRGKNAKYFFYASWMEIRLDVGFKLCVYLVEVVWKFLSRRSVSGVRTSGKSRVGR